jgi:murein DD-endopeptidase MepM/ murein hydrolase activator NlpD
VGSQRKQRQRHGAFECECDVAGDAGEPILAITGGVVVHVGPLWFDDAGSGRGPYAIIVDHGGGLYSTYSHNSEALVTFGERVYPGEQIAKMGNLGFSTTGDHVHLHLEVIDHPDAEYTGEWKAPFDLDHICTWYEDPLAYVEPP